MSFLAVTTDDGAVSTASLIQGSWTPFVRIPELTQGGARNTSVNIRVPSETLPQIICTVDDSLSRRLRFTQMIGGSWQTPKLLGTGVGSSRLTVDDNDEAISVLGLSGPTVAGWSFGLPFYQRDLNGKILHDAEDQVTRLEPGTIDPNDPVIAFDVSGSPFTAPPAPPARTGLRICLVTASGGLYFASMPPAGSSKLENIKANGAGDPGNVISVSYLFRSLNSGQYDDVCVVNDAGKIFHTLRVEGGTWLPWGDVSAATRSNETFVQIARGIDPKGNEILIAVTSSGRILFSKHTGGVHLSKNSTDSFPDPVWLPFGDVTAAAGNPGFVISADITSDHPPIG